MSSMDEVKARALALADRLDEALAKIGAASGDLLQASAELSLIFEGSGNPDLLELAGRAQANAIKLDDVDLDVQGTQNAIRDAVAFL